MASEQSEPPPQVVEQKGFSDVNDICAATVSARSAFAIHHLHAAVKAARQAHEVEVANQGADHGPWFDEMMHAVPVAIIMAAAAIEAQANEAIQDILDGNRATEAQKVLLRELKDSTASNTLEKCRHVALLFGQVPETGRAEWEEAKFPLTFRNHLIHFKPAWDHEAVHDSKWVQAMKRRIPVYAPYDREFRFPYGFITYGAAKWGVVTALTFAQHVAPILGVSNRFQSQNYVLP